MSKKFAWAALPDEQLLKVRLKDLHVTVEGTWLEDCLRDLARRAGRARPHGAAARLDFQRMVQPGEHAGHRHSVLSRPSAADAAGKEDDHRRRGRHLESECMRILRHEAGHVVQHSYELHRRRRWQQLFGPSSKRYPRYYRPNPASRNYVQHLRLWYAQSHPDEDFAETFAVWLRPRSNWRKRYVGWPALKKLEYVDELMAEIAGKRPLLTSRERGRSAQQAQRDARRVLQEEARALCWSIRRGPTTATCCGSSRPIRSIAIAETAASFIRRNRAASPRAGRQMDRRISAHRSMPCSTT